VCACLKWWQQACSKSTEAATAALPAQQRPLRCVLQGCVEITLFKKHRVAHVCMETFIWFASMITAAACSSRLGCSWWCCTVVNQHYNRLLLHPIY
jgi:hypothetical protein